MHHFENTELPFVERLIWIISNVAIAMNFKQTFIYYRPAGYLLSQPSNQPIGRSINEPISQPMKQAIKQVINQLQNHGLTVRMPYAFSTHPRLLPLFTRHYFLQLLSGYCCFHWAAAVDGVVAPGASRCEAGRRRTVPHVTARKRLNIGSRDQVQVTLYHTHTHKHLLSARVRERGGRGEKRGRVSNWIFNVLSTAQVTLGQWRGLIGGRGGGGGGKERERDIVLRWTVRLTGR